MEKNRKIFYVVGIVVIVAIAGYYFLGGNFGATPEDAASSAIDGVKKADKYSSGNSEEISMDGEEVQQLLQDEQFQQMIRNETFTELMRSAEFQSIQNDPSFKELSLGDLTTFSNGVQSVRNKILTDAASLNNDVSSLSLITTVVQDVMVSTFAGTKLDLNTYAERAIANGVENPVDAIGIEKIEEHMKEALQKNPGLEDLMKSPQFIELMKTPAFNSLAKNPQFEEMAKNPAFTSLMKNSTFNSLMKNGQFGQLEKMAKME